MAFQVSPGIDIREIDLTTTVPAVGVNTGVIAGVFRWGPTDERVLVTNENELVKRFGKPKRNYNQETFFTAADFLSYTDALYVTRVSDGNTAVGASNDINAKYPGELGNSLEVIFVDGGAYATANTFVKSLSRNAPSADTNVNIIVLDANGDITGEAGAVLEVWEDLGTVEGDKKYDGSNIYLIDVLNEKSKYVSISPTANLEIMTTTGVGSVTFSGGTDGSSEAAIALASVQAGYDLYDNPEEVDFGIVLQGKALGTNKYDLANYIIDNVCEVRKDCVLFVSPDKDDVVDNAGNETDDVISFAEGLNSTSYAVMDSGYKYRYDKYNDVYTWVPLNGDIAGLTARTDDIRDPWFSPAGYNRGILKNVVKLAWNPKKTNRDELYQARVNPVITQPGTGTLLFGDKTLLNLDSAFNRINVRRLFIAIEKSISRSAKALMFEFNDEFTRAQFVNTVEPYLRDVQGRRGIYDFRVVCDETNNTPDMIDRNEFRGDIYVKPARSINFIQLNFVAVRTGVEFEEVVGKF